MVHIRGNRKLSLRAVKRQLQVNQAHLSSAHELAALDIEPGTVHPFDPALKRLPQLLSREVLALDWVTTNAGRLDRYVVFDPVILQRAPVCVVGDFEVI